MDPEVLAIQPGAPEPIYRQIGEQLRRLICSGRLAPGEEIASVREVAGVHAINPMTVSRAYSQLEAEGLLERRRGKGMVVAETRRRLLSEDRRLEQLDTGLRELARHAHELGLPGRLVLERLQRLLENEDERESDLR
ncbi:MAG TPA: GntR family transcriptional regulator [Steroidobacteraceae bacterium]|jgi:GntR family transcriptional regulator